MILTKIKFFIMIGFYLIIIIFSKFILAEGYFHIRLYEKENIQKHQIQITNKDDILYEWLKNESPIEIHDINIQDAASIEMFLKEFKHLDVKLKNNIPGYNNFGQMNLNDISLKNPPKGLLGVYIVPRHNLFQMRYPQLQYFNTLTELLEQNKASIKEIYCFWNLKEKVQNPNVMIHYIKQDIEASKKFEYINKYIDSKNINRNNKNIRIGCYNMTPSSGMIIPLPSGEFRGQKATNVYFDDGMRIMDNNKGNLEDLLNMPNGAKNIYVFNLVDFTFPFQRPINIGHKILLLNKRYTLIE